MARVLIVERAGRTAALSEALEERGYAVRTIEADPVLPGHVVAALDGVTVVCWLMAAGENLHEEINDGQLETALLKVVDTGVRGFVFERPDDTPNAHLRYAHETWHIPVAEIAAAPDGGEQWVVDVVAAIDSMVAIAG